MTTTDLAPPPDPVPADTTVAATDPVSAHPGASIARSSPWRHGLELVLLVGLAVVAGLAFTRILPAGQLVARVVTAAVASTAVAELCRRVRPTARSAGSVGVSLGASLVAYVVITGLLLFRSDTLAGLPTPASIHAIVDALANGAARILTSAVPTPPVATALILPVTVVWLVAWSGATVAEQVESPLAPALPAVVGFGFGLLFGGDAPLVGLTTALVAMAAGLGVRAPPAAVGRGQRRARLGVPLVLVLALVAAIVATSLGTSPDQFDLHDRHPATRTFSPAITPLSQIQAALLTRPAVPQFQVTVPAADAALLPNWRLAVLDHFDGSLWSSPETYQPAGGVLPTPEGTDATTAQITERIVVRQLGGVWLPAAGQATATSLDLVDVGTTSGSLAMPGGLTPGLAYRVQATVAQFPTATMAGATPQGGGDDTALPATAPADLALIRRYAASITRQATTPAAKLTALETYLRGGHYTDTPESDSGQSYARVADFLRKNHGGTAEQFATAFALMARSLGYPTRVAVGFRRGESASGRFTVTSLDAYAWPEVHFANLGWVPYDPTPGPSGAAAPGAAAAPGTRPGPASGVVDQLTPQSGSAAPEVTPGGGGSGPAQVLLLGGLVLVVAAVVMAPLVVIALKRRRTRRRRHAPSPSQRVAGAWMEAIDQVRTAHVLIGASLTNSEAVSTAWIHLGPEVAESLGKLRTLANQARYGPEPTDEAQAEAAWTAADAVTERVLGRFPRSRRALMAVDPRPLVSSWSGT